MERPIPFSGPMVRAILEGRKTMTRIPVKYQPDWDVYGCDDAHMNNLKVWWDFWGYNNDNYSKVVRIRSPYALGQHLFVKEAWRPMNDLRGGGIPRMGITYGDGVSWKEGHPDKSGKWRSPRTMPRWASRILLEITDIRVERLQEISNEDVGLEGVRGDYYPDVAANDPHSAFIYFIELWDSINGKKHPWESNPWVWVISFKRLPC